MTTFDLSKCKPFDLERAKAGDPIVTRIGKPVIFGGHNPDANTNNEVIFWAGGTALSCNGQGKSFESFDSTCDLFMAPKKRTYWIGVGRNKEDMRHLWTSNPKHSKDEAERVIAESGNSYIVDVYPIEIEE